MAAEPGDLVVVGLTASEGDAVVAVASTARGGSVHLLSAGSLSTSVRMRMDECRLSPAGRQVAIVSRNCLTVFDHA